MRRKSLAGAVMVLTLSLAAVTPLGAQPAGFTPGVYELHAVPGQSAPLAVYEPQGGQTDVFPGSDTISYDDGTTNAYYYTTSTEAVFVVRYTPQAYPCEVWGARGRLAHWSSPSNITFRMYNHTRGVIYDQLFQPFHYTENRDTTYTLLSPITISSGDFYMGLSQTAGSRISMGADPITTFADRSWFAYYSWLFGWVWQQLSGSGGVGDWNLRALVRYHDVGASRITSPAYGQFVHGGDITPQAQVTNFAANLAEGTPFNVKYSIRDYWTGAEVWSNTQSITLAAGETRSVDFGTVSPPLAPGCYYAACSTALGLDCRPGNNRYMHPFTYFSGPTADLVIEKIDGASPAAFSSDPVAPITFQVTVRNVGNQTYPAGNITIKVEETWPVNYPGVSEVFAAPAIPSGGTATFLLSPYTRQNTGDLAVEFTFAITSAPGDPGFDNQSGILLSFLDPAVIKRKHFNDNFNSGLSTTWTRGGTTPGWDTTRGYQPVTRYTGSPPASRIRLSENHFVSAAKAGNYPDNADYWLQTGQFDLLGAVPPVYLRFSERYRMVSGDTIHVEISTNGGSTWTTLSKRTGGSWSWDTTRISLASYIDQMDLRLRFRLKSDASGSAEGWNIDDVIVAYGSHPPPVPPYPELPLRNAMLTTRTPTLQVEAGTQALRYEFRVFEQGAGLLASGVSTTRTWTVDPPLPGGVVCEWDCRYFHAALGWSEYFDPRWTFTINLPPDVPTLKYPPNNAEITVLPLTLVVDRIPGAANYEWKISLLNGTPVGSGSTTDSFWQVPSGVLNNGVWYQWTCRSKSGLGAYSDWASPRYFSVFLRPDPPEALSPPYGGEIANKTPPLQVTLVAGASEYEFRVYDMETGEKKTGGRSTSNIWSVPLKDSLLNGRWYEWDCRLKMGGVWSNYYTPRWTFRVAIKPSTPIPESPANATYVTTFQPNLRVKEASYAVDYEFRVYTHPEGVLVTSGTSPNRYWQVNIPLTNGSQYEWECRARNSAGNSAWSERWNFRVAVAPNVPTPILPEDNAEVNTHTPSLHVGRVSDATLYEFRVFKAESIASKYSTQTADTFWDMSSVLENGQAYDWNCRARNQAGWGNYFSPKRRFTVKVPPAAPELKSPENEATDQDIVGMLEWYAAEGATGYDVYLDTRNPPREMLAENQPGTSYNYAGIEYEKTYYWKIVARNAGGSTGSAVWNFRTKGAPPRDVGVERIVSPLGLRDTNTKVTPVAVFRNYWTEPTIFRAFCILNGPGDEEYYRDSTLLTLDPLTSASYEFKPYDLGTAVGEWVVVCSAFVKNDQDHSNDRLAESFSVVARPPWKKGFEEAKPMPGTAGVDKPPKDGAWIVTGPDRFGGAPVIYVAKGNKTGDFFKYYPMQDSWVKMGPRGAIPGTEGGKIKPPSKGTKGVVATRDGAIYMTRGNNMLGFWRYDIDADTWMQKKDVPTDQYKKKVKGGNDLVYVYRNDTNWVYLLKGGKTEFYRYNVELEHWDTLPNVPHTGTPSEKFDKGSFLVYDNSRYIYAHRAKFNDGKNHFMYRYDLASDSWAQNVFKGMPLYHTEAGKNKAKKSGDGAGGVWFNGHIYALKGGGTQGFFRYETAYDSWTPLDTVPRNGSGGKKVVKSGGGITYYDYGAFYVMKGNKCFELWRYLEPPYFFGRAAQPASGAMAGAGFAEQVLRVFPNPLSSGFARLRYSLPLPGPVVVSLHDVAGRVVYRQSATVGRSGVLNLDLRKLASGVYLVRLDAVGYSGTQKLVLQK